MQANKMSALRQGILDGLVFLPILAPFSLLFGVFAASVNISFFETMGYSWGIFAGASQFAALTLVIDNAPIAIAIFAGFALNLRFLLYSATLAPHMREVSVWKRAFAAYMLVDQNFVLSDKNFPERPDWNGHDKWQYYCAIMIPILVPWHFFTTLGYFTGNMIPPSVDISFGLPLAFFALIIPAIKTRPHLIAALISICGALLLRGVPYNLGLLIAAIIGICVAAEAEKRAK